MQLRPSLKSTSYPNRSWVLCCAK